MTLTRSWLNSANDPDGQFPLQNLPYGVFSTSERRKSLGVAIGDRILDLRALWESGLLRSGSLMRDHSDAFAGEDWNGVMEMGPEAWSVLRAALTDGLAEGGEETIRNMDRALVRMADAEMHLPFRVVEYTDFYAGRHHATNVGTMFRGPENALPPNWLHMPIGYNGRASSVVSTGTPVRRPLGQIMEKGADRPVLAPTRRFDFELEMGAVIGRPSEGPVSVAEADEMIFGYVLLNDWSARDFQAWEYQPLGPFQSKAAATTLGPWIVTRAALQPFRRSTPPRDVELLDYLREPGPMLYDIALEVDLAPEGAAPETIARTNYAEMYYSAAQQIAHHTISGCPMRIGDLLGSGTISGAGKDSRGSMLELSWGGEEPLGIGTQRRSFLEDGDTISFRGHAQGDGHRIGFGTCTGQVLPARETN